MNERSTDTLIRSRVREKESGIDESPVQSRRRRPEFLLGVALVVLGALGGVILQRRGDDGVLVVALARDARSGDIITAADLRALRIERSAAAAFVHASEAGALLGRIMHVDVPAGTPLTAASLAARLALTLDDDESVLLATSHGLRMLPGHEELVSLRLLVHERRGEHGAGRMYRADRDSTSRVR